MGNATSKAGKRVGKKNGMRRMVALSNPQRGASVRQPTQRGFLFAGLA
jgi:hypothetical protein